jgi:agmatine deiminase
MWAFMGGAMARRFWPEWQEQWGVLLAWPHAETDWVNNLDDARLCYRDIIAAITRYENVLLLCRDESTQIEAKTSLRSSGVDTERVTFLVVSYDDTWARDFGFISTYSEAGPVLLDFQFDAWGGKFTASADNEINRQLFRHTLLKHNQTETQAWVLEGGSIETDGLGTLLTTRKCLLNPNRNPDLSESDIEQRLKSSLGVDRVLWLDHGELEGDDTDAHIDTLARFVDEQTIVYMACSKPEDVHFSELQAMEQELRALVQPNGSPFKLVPVELPAVRGEDGRRLGGSYVNFLLVNGAVIAPIYGDDVADQAALAQLAKACPNREIVPVNCRALIEQNGSLHCITMQIPKEVVNCES